jgi:arsenate reductase
VTGTDDQKRKAVSEIARILRHRIRIFTSLPIEKLDRLSLRNKLREIGSAKAPVE